LRTLLLRISGPKAQDGASQIRHAFTITVSMVRSSSSRVLQMKNATCLRQRLSNFVTDAIAD
jgi:hypothetical protein